MSSKITQIYYLICISTKFFTLATARDLFHLDCRYNSQDIPCPQGAGKQPSNRLRKTPTCRQQTGSWYLLGSFPTRVEFSCSPLTAAWHILHLNSISCRCWAHKYLDPWPIWAQDSHQMQPPFRPHSRVDPGDLVLGRANWFLSCFLIGVLWITFSGLLPSTNLPCGTEA